MTVLEHKVKFFSLQDVLDEQLSGQLNSGYTVCKLDKDNIKDTRIREPFRTDSFGISIVLSGKLNMRIGFSEHELSQNMVFLHSPRTVGEFLHMDEDIEMISFMFSLDFIKGTGVFFNGKSSLDFLFENYLKVFSLEDLTAKRFLVYLEHLQELNSLKTPIKNQQEIVNSTCNLINYEIESVLNKELENYLLIGGRKEKLCMDFVALVNECFKQERSVQYYADRLFVSRKYLSRLVKEVTGMSPNEILEQTLMVEIVPRLKSNIFSISDIVQEFNFADLSTFGKFVKKNLGVSPSIYRKSFSINTK